MTTDDKIRDEKLKYDINSAETKRSALQSGKVDKCQYLDKEKVLPSTQQHRTIQKVKFTYSQIRKILQKEAKTI